MALSTVVKVGNISNLSDARYCAGMGVDMLGFTVIENQPDFLPPKAFQEIRGWISGPKIVAQLYGAVDIDLERIIADYAPDFLELTLTQFETLNHKIKLPCLVSLENSLDRSLPKGEIAYLIIEDKRAEALPQGLRERPILISLSSSDNVLEKVETGGFAGVALSGSPEQRPGFKDYADLAEVLEQLDT